LAWLHVEVYTVSISQRSGPSIDFSLRFGIIIKGKSSGLALVL
jgi:hypothetical protein